MRRLLMVGIAVLMSFAAPPPAGAQGPSGPQAPSAADPWWPDASAGPPQFGAPSTWDMRIPLRLTSTAGADAGAPVQTHLDLAKALVDVGWPAIPGLPAKPARSFTLDPGSIRLVQYTATWAVQDPTPVAAKVQLGWLDPDQRATQGRLQTTPYDAQRDPLVTLQWLLPSAIAPGQAQNYYAFFDILQNGARAPAVPDEGGQEALGGRYWMGAGTLLYGRNNGNTLAILAGDQAATVEVRVSKSPGAAFALDKPLSGDPNPFPLAAGAMKVYNVQGASDLQIRADKPVVAFLYTTDGQGIDNLRANTGQFFPSLDGGLVGRHFLFPPLANTIQVIVPQVGGGTSYPDLPDGEPAVVCVRILNPTQPLRQQGQPCPAGAQRTDPIEPGDYAALAVSTFVAGARIEVTTDPGSGPVLVQSVPDGSGSSYQAPSTHGAPVGQRFLAAGPRPGSFTLRSVGEPAWVDVSLPGRQGAPPGSPDPTRPRVEVCAGTENGPYCLAPVGTPLGLPTNNFVAAGETSMATAPLAFTARRAPLVDSSTDGRLLLSADSGGSQQATAFGGDHARTFQVRGPFVIDAFHDDTRVTVVSQRQNGPATTSLRMVSAAPSFFGEAATVQSTVVADKPIAVLPTASSATRALVARPAFLVPDQLPAHFRGYLVDLEGPGGADPLFINGRPGQTVVVPLTVRNLGRWGTQPIIDSIRLTATAAPADWGGRLEFGSDVVSAGSEAQQVDLEVTLPATGGILQDDGQVTVAITARSEHNPNMAASLTAILSSRPVYKVEAHFGDENDPATKKTIDERFEKGETIALPFIVKNLGTGPDEFKIELGDTGSWQAEVLQAGQRTSRVSIEAGELAHLELSIHAPSGEGVGLNLQINIRSMMSALAADTLIANVKIRVPQGLEVSASEAAKVVLPGDTAKYTVFVKNTGTGKLNFKVALAATLLPGWSASFEDPPNQEGSTLEAGDDLKLVVLVTAPADALARQVVPVVVRAESLDGEVRDAIGLSTLVAALHDLRVTAPAAGSVRPGQSMTASARVTNLGNVQETVRLVPLALPGNWSFSSDKLPRAVARGGSVDLAFTVRVPAFEAPASQDIRVAAVAADGTAFPFTMRIAVGVEEALSWSEAASVLIAGGSTVHRTLTLSNDGNRAEAVTLSAQAPLGWSVTLEPESFTLPSQSSRTVALTLTAPASGTGIAGDVVIVAQAATRQASASFTAALESPLLAVSDVVAPLKAPAPGSVLYLTAAVQNLGAVAMAPVHVRLMSGSEVIDDIRLESLGPNGTALAPLRWVHESGPAPDRIEWGVGDGSGFLPLGSRPVAALEEEGPARDAPGILAPGVLLALAAALALARRRRGAA